MARRSTTRSCNDGEPAGHAGCLLVRCLSNRIAYRPTGRYDLGMAPTNAPETNTRILDAVMKLILRGGLPAVTLSAVCRQAGISKGGLMHHFPCKESLVDAFLQRSVEEYLHAVRQAAEQHVAGTGQRSKAILDLFLGEPDGCETDDCGDCAAVMVALVQGGGDPTLVDEVSQTLFQWMRDDGLSQELAELIVVTLDGVWLQSLIATSDTLVARKKRIRNKLNQFIDGELLMKTAPLPSTKGRT